MEFWKVLKLSELTDENDFRSMCANKLKGPYVIIWGVRIREVAVLLDNDVSTVLSAFDVTDRRLATSVYQGNKLMVAVTAWSDYKKNTTPNRS